MPLDPAAVDALVERARRDVDSGHLPAAQVALAHEGELVVFEAFGDASTESRFHTYSMIKPVVALTLMELAAEGLLDLGTPVADHLPTFGCNGKTEVTVSQVLLHAGGCHSGAKGQIAAADPATGISYCFMTNGLDRDDLINGRRGIAIATRAIACGHHQEDGRRRICQSGSATPGLEVTAADGA